jgi:hypothetical protein
VKPPTATTATPAPGIIDPAAVYTLAELQARTKLGTWALRSLRRRGLRVIRFGGRGFVRGADFIAAIESAQEAGQ